MRRSFTPAHWAIIARRASHIFLVTILSGAVGQVLAGVRPGYQMATRVAATNNGCVALACGAVVDAAFAVDTDTLSAAKITSPPALAAATLRLQYALVAQIGYQAGIVLSSQNGVSLSTLANVRVRTYFGNSQTPQQDFSASSLLTVVSLDSEPTKLSFTATAPFDQIELSAGGLITASYTVQLHYADSYNPNALPLPVVLSSFTGKATHQVVDLAWQTASEQNAGHFVVERASEAHAAFEALGRVASQGTSTRPQAYRFRDGSSRTAAGVLYYRLRQVDLDGKETLSPMVVVTKTAGGYSLYPNPAVLGQPLQVARPAADNFVRRVRVFGSRGDLVCETQLDAATAGFVPAVQNLGLYWVVLLDAADQPLFRQRVVLQGD